MVQMVLSAKCQNICHQISFHFILLRTVLLLWGVNKFTKKLREADPIPTNEIDNLVRLDFD